MTSLTPKEIRVVHELDRFASETPQCLMVNDRRELIRQLYRFTYFYPSKKKRVKIPEDWYSDYTEPHGSLQTTARKVQEWFTRPEALKPPEAPQRPPSPDPVPQAQSPLHSVLPTEIRENIFKLVITSSYKGCRKRCITGCPNCHPQRCYCCPITLPAITAASRLVRRETLELFFKHTHFAFPTHFGRRTIEAPVKWLYAMRPHLPRIHQITFFVDHYAKNDTAVYGDITVTIRHDPSRDCWTTTCEDDWTSVYRKEDEPEKRQALERDDALLCRLMRTMVEGRSRADLTPEYLMWLMHDARIFYTTEKMEGPINGMGIYNKVNMLAPQVRRPPDMYSTDIEYDLMVRWLHK